MGDGVENGEVFTRGEEESAPMSFSYPEVREHRETMRNGESDANTLSR